MAATDVVLLEAACMKDREVSDSGISASTDCSSPSVESEEATPVAGERPASPLLLKRGGLGALLLAPRGPLADLVTKLVHPLLYMGCVVLTRSILGFRSFLAHFLRGGKAAIELERPEARLTWEALRDAKDPCDLVRSLLPVPPPLPAPPADGWEVSFGPCANLMIYTGGVAACLQRCPNYAEVFPRLRFYGASCGAFVASSMAADCDMMSMLPEMLAWTEKFQGRLWGLVGAYSESIAAIVRGIFSDPERFETARSRLGIGVTVFSPLPHPLKVRSFGNAEDLMSTLLGSCYIPVAFESPVWSRRFGPLWDGGIFEFAVLGDVVASPYGDTLPDIAPKEPYPTHMSFFPPHEEDAIRLFEDGYMDCLRWLEAGAPSRSARRTAVFGAAEGGMAPLINESRKFLKKLIFGTPSTSPAACR